MAISKQVKEVEVIDTPVEHRTSPVHRRTVTTIMQGGKGWLAAAVGLVIIVGVAGFIVGMQYQKGRTTTVANAGAQGQFGQAGAGGQGMGGPGGRAMNGSFGSVTAVSDTSISVKDDRSGSTKTYTISSSTMVTDNGSTASVSDIKTGDTVMVRTSSSTSTAVTAIMLNPAMGGGPGQGNSQGSDGMQQSSGATDGSST